MLRKWTRLLPLFIVVWLAKYCCEKFVIQKNQKWYLAFDDVLVKGKWL